MADYLEIIGGNPLKGKVKVSGAKNAALPILIASLLTPEKCEFTNVPNLEDIHLTLRILEHFGASFSFAKNKVSVATPKLVATEASYSLVKALRASFWVLGPLLARGRAARVALPGGDIIGARPVDMHLKALTEMGADIIVKHGIVYATAKHGLNAATIDLPFASVGATHQIIMAACLTKGTTVIRGAAREPEIVALAEFINAMGGDIEGSGTSIITIHGKEELHGATIDLIGDRIEAATYLLAGASTFGSVHVDGVSPAFFGRFLDVLNNIGLHVESGESFVAVKRLGALRPVHVVTGPFPEFATDIQAILMAFLSKVEGCSTIEETVFEGRFSHVSELCRMGASIQVRDRVATITGVEKLSGAPVEANDIRAGAALVIAALSADGTTQLYEPQHLRRGYDSLEEKIGSLGGHIVYRKDDPEDSLLAGC